MQSIAGKCFNESMDTEKKYWLAFSAFFQIGPKKFKILLDYFGSASKAWEASDQEIKSLGMGEKTTTNFLKFRTKFEIDKYIEKLNKNNIKILTLKDKLYPKLLSEIPDPPYLLYVKTNLDIDKLFESPCIAVVGTRNISTYGKFVTEKFVSELSDLGFTIVSGFVRGVDICSHKAAIKNKGKTIAVIGSGLLDIYPSSNMYFAKNILDNGAFISEFPLEMRAFPGNFPQRNRIVSGLSLGVLVIEAAQKSGTLITASHAADQGREVFAVPGPITSYFSKGTSKLIQKGAKLVTDITDIAEEFPDLIKSKVIKLSQDYLNLSIEEKAVVDILKKMPVSLDELVSKSKSAPNRLITIVSLLEIKGIIEKVNGMLYYKKV